MERLPHREEYENLLAKQEQERADLRNEAHGEALAMNEEIGEHEEKFKELKGTPESQTEKSASHEKLKCKAIELPEMAGNSQKEVYEYLKKTYGEDKLAKIPHDLNTLPEEFKDGKQYCFFGSASKEHYRSGAYSLNVPNVTWDDGRGEWYRAAYWMGSLEHDRTGNFARIVLLEE